MLDQGFLAAGAFSPTWAHEDWQVDRYLEACGKVFTELAEAVEKCDAEKRLGTPVKHTGFRRLA